MAYSRTTWVDGTTPAINATNLNNIEQGIVDLDNGTVKLTGDQTVAGNKTFTGTVTIQASGNPADGGGGTIRTAGSRYTLVLKPRNADATYADASEFYYDSTYVGWWAESKMGCGGDFTVNASAFIQGTASADPVLRVDAVDGRTPYLTLRSQGANDVYMGWIRGNTTRFYFRCTQDTWSIRSADDSGNIWGSAPYGNVFHIDRTNSRVTLGGHTTGKYEAGLEFGTSGPREMVGTGSPEGAVTAPVGSEWKQTDHATLGYCRWIKLTGSGNTGWYPDFEGRWITYSGFSVSSSGTQPSGWTNTARYTQTGKTISMFFRSVASASVGTGTYRLGLPVTAATTDQPVLESSLWLQGGSQCSSLYIVWIPSGGSGSYAQVVAATGSSTYGSAVDWGAATPFTWANTYELRGSFTYEAA